MRSQKGETAGVPGMKMKRKRAREVVICYRWNKKGVSSPIDLRLHAHARHSTLVRGPPAARLC